MFNNLTMLEVWLSTDEDGTVVAVLQTVDLAASRAFIASEEFGPFDTERDLANWVWRSILHLAGLKP